MKDYIIQLGVQEKVWTPEFGFGNFIVRQAKGGSVEEAIQKVRGFYERIGTFTILSAHGKPLSDEKAGDFDWYGQKMIE